MCISTSATESCSYRPAQATQASTQAARQKRVDRAWTSQRNLLGVWARHDCNQDRAEAQVTILLSNYLKLSFFSLVYHCSSFCSRVLLQHMFVPGYHSASIPNLELRAPAAPLLTPSYSKNDTCDAQYTPESSFNRLLHL